MRGSGFSTPTTEESSTKSIHGASPVASRVRAAVPFEFEITPTTSAAAFARASAGAAAASAWVQRPKGAL
jgi:hypothetical protein